MREKSFYASNDYLAAVDVLLHVLGDIFQTEELALLAPRVMLPSCSISNHWAHVVRPLGAPHVQFGHFPSGKVAAINSHPAPTLPVGCSA